MIRFACPGCGASYSVGDDKAGRSGKCPKCQAQFRIPDAEPAAAPPPPPVSEAAVEIAPCPKCRARLSVPSEDLGAEVECPYCQTVYVAKRFDVPSVPPRRPSPPPTDDEDEERPSRSSRYDEDDVRTRRDDEDDEPRRRRRRRRSDEGRGPLTTVGVFNYVLDGLSFCCSCFLFVAGTMIEELLKRQKQNNPNFDEDIDPDLFSVLCFGMGAGYLLYAVLLLVAGMGVTARKTYGRILTFVTGGGAILLSVLSLVNAGFNLVDGNAPGACGAVVMALVLAGYGFYALFAMIKYGDEFS